jgi:hypothetical protein
MLFDCSRRGAAGSVVGLLAEGLDYRTRAEFRRWPTIKKALPGKKRIWDRSGRDEPVKEPIGGMVLKMWIKSARRKDEIADGGKFPAGRSEYGYLKRFYPASKRVHHVFP